MKKFWNNNKLYVEYNEGVNTKFYISSLILGLGESFFN